MSREGGVGGHGTLTILPIHIICVFTFVLTVPHGTALSTSPAASESLRRVAIACYASDLNQILDYACMARVEPR